MYRQIRKTFKISIYQSIYVFIALSNEAISFPIPETASLTLNDLNDDGYYFEQRQTANPLQQFHPDNPRKAKILYH